MSKKKDEDSITQYSLKLHHFDAIGPLETTKLLLKIAGGTYTESTYKATVQNGRPSCPELDAAAEKGYLAASFGNLPMLEVHRSTLAKDHTKDFNAVYKVGGVRPIERYVARLHGLMGDDDAEGAQIEGICDFIKEIKDTFAKIKAIQVDRKREESIKKWFATDLKPWLLKLEASLKAMEISTSRTGYAVGTRISLADLSFYTLLQDTFKESVKVNALLTNCPKLNDIQTNIGSHPKVREYYQAREEAQNEADLIDTVTSF